MRLFVWKDNEDILPFWLEYHSALVGIENIVLLDNYSDESSETPHILRKWIKKGLKVEWDQGPYTIKGQLTHTAFKKHFPKVDIGIPLDIDEIVVGFKDGSPVPTKRAFHEGIEDFWKSSIGCGALTQYYPTCCNDVSDTVETVDRAIHLVYSTKIGKKMFRIGQVKDIDHGNHHISLKNENECVDAPLSLGLLHYHYRNPRLTLEHALTDLRGFGYIDESVTAETAHEYLEFFKSLIEEQVDGSHKATEVIEYIKHGYKALMHSCGKHGGGVYRIGNFSTILTNL